MTSTATRTCELLERRGPFTDGDADVYICIFRLDGHVYARKFYISGCFKAVGGDLNRELAYQMVRARRELEREVA